MGEKVTVDEREHVTRGRDIYLREFTVVMTKLCHVRKGARRPRARRLRGQEGKREKRSSVAKNLWIIQKRAAQPPG